MACAAVNYVYSSRAPAVVPMQSIDLDDDSPASLSAAMIALAAIAQQRRARVDSGACAAATIRAGDGCLW
jgi:hypothetical protein